MSRPGVPMLRRGGRVRSPSRCSCSSVVTPHAGRSSPRAALSCGTRSPCSSTGAPCCSGAMPRRALRGRRHRRPGPVRLHPVAQSRARRLRSGADAALPVHRPLRPDRGDISGDVLEADRLGGGRPGGSGRDARVRRLDRLQRPLLDPGLGDLHPCCRSSSCSERWPARIGALAAAGIALLAGWLTSMRSEALPVVLALAAVVLMQRWRWWRSLAALAVLAVAYLSINSLLIPAVREHRDDRLGTSALSRDRPRGHPFWHTAYIGLGYLSNGSGLRYQGRRRPRVSATPRERLPVEPVRHDAATRLPRRAQAPTRAEFRASTPPSSWSRPPTPRPTWCWWRSRCRRCSSSVGGGEDGLAAPEPARARHRFSSARRRDPVSDL